MTYRAKRLIKIFLGWALLALGMLGLVLPFLQGIVFLVLGLLVLGQVQKWPNTLMNGIFRRFPRARTGMESARVKAENLMRRWNR